MIANIVDLRYKMKEVLKALARKERVEILYRGKTKGIIIPHNEPCKKSVAEHPLCGSRNSSKESVKEIMRKLRAPRYNDL